MDFLQIPVTKSFGVSREGASGYGNGALSNLSSEDNQRTGINGSAVSSQTNVQQPLMSAQNTIKSSRTGSAGHGFLLDVDDGDELVQGGPLKLARKELYGSCRQSDLSIPTHWASAGGGNGFPLLKGINSFCMDDHSPWSSSSNSPTNAQNSISDAGSQTYIVQGDPRFLPRTDSSISYSAYACSPRERGIFWPFYPHQYNSQACGNRSTSLFTSSQRVELEDQALIFKYMMAGSTIPTHLLVPILKSLSAIRGVSSLPFHSPSSAAGLGWANFYPGVASNPDPEPGRCRRTDGKKWRCARDAVPDQKYCDRHIHRGRNRRSRKLAESQNLTSSTSNSHSSGAAVSFSSPTSTAPNCALAAQRANFASANLEHSESCNNTATRQASMTPSQQSFSTFAGRNQELNNPYNEHAQQLFLSFQSTCAAPTYSNKQLQPERNGLFGNGGNNKDDAIPAANFGSEQLFFSELARRDQPSPSRKAASASYNSSSMENQDHMFRSTLQGSLRHESYPHCLSALAQHERSSSINAQRYSSSPRRDESMGFSGITDRTEIDIAIPQEAQQKSNFLGAAKETTEQPLRHFFDDWPRNSKDHSAISWVDQTEDQAQIKSMCCGTQLSISIPTSTSDHDSPAEASFSPSREMLGRLPPLTLSMTSRPAEEKFMATAPDRMQMKLGMNIGLGIDPQNRHRHPPSLPISSWEAAATATPVGGPLAEMLQSSSCSTPAARGSSTKPSSGLNLLCEGWEISSRDSPHNQLSSRSPPSAVLHESIAAAASNAGSCCSSPAHGAGCS